MSVGEGLEFSDGNHYASLEQILMWNPDYILVNDPNLVGYIMNHEHWRPLKAVKNNRVLALPIRISRWGHQFPGNTSGGVVDRKLAYPELFEDWDIVKATQDFYKEFFDWELDEATVDKMLKAQACEPLKDKAVLWYILI